MSTIAVNDSLLRKSMKFNGVFSGLSGAAFLLFSQGLAVFMGLGADGAVQNISLGASLLFFAGFLLLTSSNWTQEKRRILIFSGEIAILLDVLWVLGTVAVLLGDFFPLSVGAKWMFAIIGIFVLDFAIFQAVGLWRVLKK